MSRIVATFSLCAALALVGFSTDVNAGSVGGANATPIEWGFIGTSPVTSGEAIPFPSDIVIGPGAGIVKDVTVTLRDAAHTWSGDLEITLVGPDGTAIMLMSGLGVDDIGGTSFFGNSDDLAGTYTFSDAAATEMPMTTGGAGFIAPGTYLPSVSPGNTVDSPVGPNAVGLSAYAGGPASGVWSLYVFDQASGDTGAIAGGWSISIESNPIPEPGTLGLMALAGLALAALRMRKKLG